MTQKITFSKATTADLTFVVDSIIASEKSGTETLSWAKIFEVAESEVRELIELVLAEEIDGQEWCLHQFELARIGSRPIAALSAWIEGESGMSSGILKSQAISFLWPEKWIAARPNMEQLATVQLPRIQGALQLENIYTDSDFRGHGVARALIQNTIIQYKKEHPLLEFAEIQLMANNENALRSYTKCGFLPRAQSAVSGISILNLLPGRQRISLQSKINHGSSADQAGNKGNF